MPLSDLPTETVVLNDATIVPGDGSPLVRGGAVVMAGGRIVSVSDSAVAVDDPAFERADIVDVAGDIVMPGLVDSHVHHVVEAPFSASASDPPTPAVAKRNRDRHLMQGTSTVINVDTFALPSDITAGGHNHPLKIELGACPSPANLDAARASDGSGLHAAHESYTIPEAVAAGAVMLGEVGSGSTLAGSLQRIKYVPDAVEERTGQEITAAAADDLITAVIGRYADPDHYDEAAAEQVLEDTDLRDALDPEALKDLIMEVTWPSVEKTLDGFEEVSTYATQYDLPVMVHNAAASMDKTRELAERGVPLVAGHSNHPTFAHEEALEFAAEIGSYENVTIDISTWDLFTDSDRQRPEKQAQMREQFFEFVERGLVDTVTTDWSWQHPGGEYHSLLVPLQAIVERDILPLAEAVTLVCGTPAETYPAIGATRGTIEPGAAADVLVLDEDDLTDIRRLYIDGRPALVDGELSY
ncbi:amidohydrolase family protein [Halovenus marina]|uniref:amidohydrolase family protein n=1 Tax=Halovenus marina TaxID=3396621 RepID=UPI003F568790